MSDSPRKKEKKEKKKEKKKGNTSARERPPTEPQLEEQPEDFGGPVSKASLELKDCPVSNVTVYNDRAEVTRTITTNIKAGILTNTNSYFIRVVHQLTLQ